jgi:hypothetical protein
MHKQIQKSKQKARRDFASWIISTVQQHPLRNENEKLQCFREDSAVIWLQVAVSDWGYQKETIGFR